MYNFNKVINRLNTGSLKWDAKEAIFGTDDVIPMWVADMDIKAPLPVIKALTDYAKFGIYGYPVKTELLYNSILNWHKINHNLEFNKENIFFTPGVVPAIFFSIQALTFPGDKIIVQPPVYFPFFSAVNINNRKLVYNQLVETESSYKFDFKDLEKKAKTAKMLIICNPHNPAGRVWTFEELDKLAFICNRNNLLVLSDEIHSDLVFKPHKHIPFCSISKQTHKSTVTFYSPSKTFNTAGLSSSYMICYGNDLKKKLKNHLDKIHVDALNNFGLIAMEKAYSDCRKWLDNLLVHLENNYIILKNYITKKIPDVTVFDLQATYLVWLSFKKIFSNDNKLKEFIIKKAHLGLNEGTMFGPGGEGFQRINIACPKITLIKALNNLEKAIKEIL